MKPTLGITHNYQPLQASCLRKLAQRSLRLDLLAAAELGATQAIQDYMRAQQEEGGLLPRQWLQESPLKLQASRKSSPAFMVVVGSFVGHRPYYQYQTAEGCSLDCIGYKCIPWNLDMMVKHPKQSTMGRQSWRSQVDDDCG